MSAGNNGGAAVWIWVLIGAGVGLGAGWWYEEIVTYTLLLTLLGWFIGLNLAHAGDDDAH